MDLEKRELVIERCGEVQSYNGGGTPKILPLLSLEEYFDGADGESGILCNVPAAPADEETLALLLKIRARPDVSDVRIAITQIEDDLWPFSDTILVVTTASAEQVASWFPEDMAPDECIAELRDDVVHEPFETPNGSRAVWLWFD